MVKAGDGELRSERRQLTDSICIRCTARDKSRFKKVALRFGFPSLSAWVMDLMQTQGRMSLRLRRVMSGQLGQIGARLAVLACRDLPDDAKAETSALAAEIARMQHDLMTGLPDAPETD